MADEILEPVNVADPVWQCPICETKHGRDLRAAQACVSLGPVPSSVNGVLAVRLAGHGTKGLAPEGYVGFGLLTVARTIPMPKSGSHELLYRYFTGSESRVVAAERLDGHEPGDVIFDPEPDRESSEGHSPYGSSYISPSAVAGGSALLGSVFPDTELLVHKGFGYPKSQYQDIGLSSFDHIGWIGPISDEIDAALGVLNPKSWSEAKATTVQELVGYTTGSQRRNWQQRQGHWPMLLDREQAMECAFIHGFGPRQARLAQRWFSVHYLAIITHLAERVIGWINGENITIPLSTVSHSPLPATPGLRRTAALAPFLEREVLPGDKGTDIDYRTAVRTIDALLQTERPTGPLIPGVPTAIEFAKDPTP